MAQLFNNKYNMDTNQFKQTLALVPELNLGNTNEFSGWIVEIYRVSTGMLWELVGHVKSQGSS